MASLNIQKYKRRSYRKKKGLSNFLRKLSKSNQKDIIKTVTTVNQEVWNEVDCISCANCCKTMTPTYTRKDVSRLAGHFKMTYAQFFDKWLKHDENKDIINKSLPCQFLGNDNMCTIYAIRPDDCAGFPHFVRRDFLYQAREKTYINNISHCPATLVFIEKLKVAIEADL